MQGLKCQNQYWYQSITSGNGIGKIECIISAILEILVISDQYYMIYHVTGCLKIQYDTRDIYLYRSISNALKFTTENSTNFYQKLQLPSICKLERDSCAIQSLIKKQFSFYWKSSKTKVRVWYFYAKDIKNS